MADQSRLVLYFGFRTLGPLGACLSPPPAKENPATDCGQENDLEGRVIGQSEFKVNVSTNLFIRTLKVRRTSLTNF